MSDKILGKYESVDQLADAYKGLKSQYDQLASGRNKFTVPDSYSTNKYEFVESRIVNDALDRANNYGFTQAQFEKDMTRRIEAAKKSKETKEAFAEEFKDLEDLKEFVTKELNLPETMFRKLDQEELKAMRKRRDKAMNTTTKVGSSAAQVDDAPRAKVSELFKEMTKAQRSGNDKLFQEYFQRYTKACKGLKK